MRKILIVLIIILTTNISCKTDDDNGLSNTCNIDNPVEDLDWLKEKIDEFKEMDSDISPYFYITQANHNKQTIFIFPNCCPVCNTIIQVFNCQGEVIGYLGDDVFDSRIVENDEIIWKPENFACF